MAQPQQADSETNQDDIKPLYEFLKGMPPLLQSGKTNLLKPVMKPTEKSSAIGDLVWVEKTLGWRGVFAASSTRNKTAEPKRVILTHLVNGKKEEFPAVMYPTKQFGLPNAADLLKFAALQKITQAQKSALGGKISTEVPILFSSPEMLRILSHGTRSGKLYKEVDEFLDLFAGLYFIGEVAILNPMTGKTTKEKLRFHIFDAYSRGQTLANEEVVEHHAVFYSKWIVDKINAGSVLPLNLEHLLGFKYYIALTSLLPLKVWLFAAWQQGKPFCEVRYDRFSYHLSLIEFRHRSRILQQLKPAFNELVKKGYLARWSLIKTKDGTAWKLRFWRGERFELERDLIAGGGDQVDQLEVQAEHEVVEQTTPANPLVARLKKWGFPAQDAVSLLAELAPDQPVAEQLEYWEHVIAEQGIGNEPGDQRQIKFPRIASLENRTKARNLPH